MAGRTFGSKLAGGFALTVALTLLMGIASVLALTIVVGAKDDVITRATDGLIAAERLNTTAEARLSDFRAFILNGQQKYLDLTNADRARFLDEVGVLKGKLTNPAEIALLNTVSAYEAKHAELLAPVIERRKAIKDLRNTAELNATNVGPARQALLDSIAALTAQVRSDVAAASRKSGAQATQAVVVVIVLGLLSIGSAVLIAYRLNRGLRREVGTAV
ncbi:MAG TPA: methyl-accepting chemotaxis protein, partial [Actinoplanes sp.]|nr:methyl-accepting chemotaxis protein [Actinoplanes sp.]